MTVTGKQGSLYNYVIIAVVSLGSFTYGFNNSIIGAVFGLPGFFEYFNLSLTSTDGTTTSILGATNGLFFGGALIGCGLVGWLPDKVGRVRNFQIICIVCVIGAIVQGASVHIAMFLVGRFLGGLGSGMICPSVPLYMSECSPAAIRGRLVGAHGFLLVVGYGLAGWAGYGCYFEQNAQISWRLVLSLQVIAPVALMLSTPWLPESPRWLVVKQRSDQALKNLKKLHSVSNDPSGLLAREELFQIEKQVELDSRPNIPQNILQMIKMPSYRKRLIAGSLSQFLAQSTGVLVINNYQVLLYTGLGLGGSTPLLLYAIYTTWASCLNCVAALIVDKVGRVRLLTIGYTGAACMLICFTAIVANFSGTTNKLGNGFGVFFLFSFVTFYAGCVDAPSFIYCSEIFPTHVRAQGLSIAVAVYLAAALVYTQSAPTAFAGIGWKFYLVFICISLIGAPFFYWYCPETKLLTLEEISKVFGDEVAVDITHMTEAERARLDEELIKPNDTTIETIRVPEKA